MGRMPVHQDIPSWKETGERGRGAERAGTGNEKETEGERENNKIFG